MAGEPDRRPSLVRFVNDQELSPADRKDKCLAKCTQDSQGLLSVFDMMDPDLASASRMFRRYSVSVSSVDPKDSPSVNRVNAPVLVVLDAEGHLVKTLGPGPVRKAELLSAMGQALKGGVSLDQALSEGKAILKELQDIESLRTAAETKRSIAARAKGDAKAKVEAEADALEKKADEREAALSAREERLFGKDSEGTGRRGPGLPGGRR